MVTPATELDEREAALRARKIRVLLTDCDGVLTDNGVYYSPEGEVMKRFSIRDGMGVERLRNAGIVTGIISGERSESLKRRAEKLRIEHLYLGVRDKRAELATIVRDTGWSLDQIAFIGDDCNDLGIIAEIDAGKGLTAAPADAMPDVMQAVHHRCTARGGHGAFRDFVEWILGLQSTGETR